MKREDVLDRAKEYTTGDRESSYGSPEDNFTLVAALWSAYLGITVLPHDIALLMTLLKVARLKANPRHEDSWVDIAGYAACGGEVATRVKEPIFAVARRGSVTPPEYPAK